MIVLGLRLTLSGGREAAARLAIIVAAVAVGTGMLLTTLAGINAVNAQNARYAWLETGAGPATHTSSIGAPGGADPIWWLLTADEFRGKPIGRVDVAATGPHSPLPPGLPRLPEPGAVLRVASAQHAAALDPRRRARRPVSRPAGRHHRRRRPPIARLTHRRRRAVRPRRSRRSLGAGLVTGISTTAPSSCSGPCYSIGIDASGIDLILSIVAAALLFPVLIFIATATRLSAARREQRFAALRLVGATPRQVAVISAVESTLAATLGVAAGFGLFFGLRPALAAVPFTGEPFFLADLSLNATDMLLVALGVPVGGRRRGSAGDAAGARLPTGREPTGHPSRAARVAGAAAGGWHRRTLVLRPRSDVHSRRPARSRGTCPASC